MTITKENGEALTELYEIILKMSPELQEKIPINLKRAIADKRDRMYFYKVGNEIKPETKAMLSVIASEYLCNEDQKKKFNEIDKLYNRMSEKQKEQKYNSDKIFENGNKVNICKNNESKNENKSQREVSMIEHKESLFNKIVKKIKRFFK